MRQTQKKQQTINYPSKPLEGPTQRRNFVERALSQQTQQKGLDTHPRNNQRFEGPLSNRELLVKSLRSRKRKAEITTRTLLKSPLRNEQQNNGNTLTAAIYTPFRQGSF